MSEQVQEPAPAAAESIQAAGGVVADGKPEGLPDDLWDPEANTIKAADAAARFKELATVKEQADTLAATVVDDPTKIDWNLGLKTEDGKEIEFDTADPLFAAVGQTFAAEKIPTAYLKPLASAFVRAQQEADRAATAAAKAEFDALGEKAAERVQSVVHAIGQRVGVPTAQKFVGGLSTAAQVEVLEKLIAAFAEPNPGKAGEEVTDVTISSPAAGTVFFRKRA